MKEDSKSVEARLRRLESWNRLLLAIVAIGFFSVLMGEKSGPAALQAESIQLIGDGGDVLAELAVRAGNPGLYVNDENGQTRLALFHAPDGTGLYITDGDGVTRIGIAQFAHGGGGVALHGEKSRGAAVLYFKDDGSLRFFDAEGSVTNEVTARKSLPAN